MEPWIPVVLYLLWAALFVWVVFIARQVRQISGRVTSLLDAYDRVSARSFVAGVKVGQELERDSQGKDQTE